MQASFDIRNEQGTLSIIASGSWERGGLASGVSAGPLMDAAFTAMEEPGVKAVRFSAPALESWDSLLLAAMNAIAREAVKRGLAVHADALPDGMAITALTFHVNTLNDLETVKNRIRGLPGVIDIKRGRA